MVVCRNKSTKGENIRNVKEIQKAFCVYVKTEVFNAEQLPPGSSRRFYHAECCICNHMYNGTPKSHMSKLDQENVSQLIQKFVNVCVCVFVCVCVCVCVCVRVFFVYL